jgi:hypothetical protein
MHLLGRHTVDDRTLHCVRRFETWERFQRARDAEFVARYVLDNRQKYALGVHDLKRLDRWIDRVFVLGLGAVPGAGNTGGGAVLTPVDVVGTANIAAWWRTDSGITLGTGVGSWVPIVGTGTFAQATSTKQPLFTANDSTLFGRGTFVGDGFDDYLTAPLTLATPSLATPNFFRFIFKTVVHLSGLALLGTGSNQMSVTMGGVSPALLQRNTVAVNSNTGAPVGTWTRLEVYFSGTTADSLKLGSTLVAAGVSAAATVPGPNFTLCARTTASYSQSAFSEGLALNILPSSLQLALLDGLTAHFYKGTVAQ